MPFSCVFIIFKRLAQVTIFIPTHLNHPPPLKKKVICKLKPNVFLFIPSLRNISRLCQAQGDASCSKMIPTPRCGTWPCSSEACTERYQKWFMFMPGTLWALAILLNLHVHGVFWFCKCIDSLLNTFGLLSLSIAQSPRSKTCVCSALLFSPPN